MRCVLVNNARGYLNGEWNHKCSENRVSSWYHSVAKLEEHMDTISVPFPRSILFRNRRQACRSMPYFSVGKKRSKATVHTGHCLVERLDHGVLVCGVDVAWPVALTQPEDRLDDRELSRCRIEASDSHPVVDNHTGTDDRATSVHTTCNKRDLEQTRQFVLVLNRCLGVHDTALIAQRHVRACENVIRDCLPEDLHAKHICYYLLCLALDVRVYEGDVVVAANDVAER